MNEKYVPVKALIYLEGGTIETEALVKKKKKVLEQFIVTDAGAFTDISDFRIYYRRLKIPIRNPEEDTIPKDVFERAKEFVKIIKEGRFAVYRRVISGLYPDKYLYIPEKKRYVSLGSGRLTQFSAHSSYYWKHIAERAIGDYISNGAFIASCILEKIAIKDWEGPNVRFEMNRIPTLVKAFKNIKDIDIPFGALIWKEEEVNK
jgi:hypothetical protein